MRPFVFDMETGDPDDVLTLLWFLGHPQVDLRAVTVTPGTPYQVGVVRHVLGLMGTDIPVGAFNIKHGAVFGLSHGLTQLAAFRPPVRTGIPQLDSPEVDGLHFVGASTRPGNGVPLVLMGVKVVFEKIMQLHGAGVKAAKR